MASLADQWYAEGFLTGLHEARQELKFVEEMLKSGATHAYLAKITHIPIAEIRYIADNLKKTDKLCWNH